MAVVEKLQRVQNVCARVILIRPKRDHVTPMLLELHWFPVKCRITEEGEQPIETVRGWQSMLWWSRCVKEKELDL